MTSPKVNHIDGLAILGPTGIGKTAISIAIAKRINGEVIGLDSRQIYKGMEIGTAQPTKKEQDGIPHHLIGIRNPDQDIAAGEYAELVIAITREIKQRGKIPVICGGAGLYFKAITEGLFKDSSTFPDIRKRLNKEYEDNGGAELLGRLKELDPDYAKIVHPNNKKRLVRALEIYEGTGMAPSEHFKLQKKGYDNKETLSLFSVLLCMDRKELQERIQSRAKKMLAEGWLDEVKKLISSFPGKKLPSMDSIGYREIQEHLRGGKSLMEIQEEIIIRTRQYAKRQEQWFIKEKIDLLVELSNSDRFESALEKIMSKIPFNE